MLCAKKDYIGNSTTLTCENGKYLASVVIDSVITCGEIIEMTKTIPTKLNAKKSTCKTKNLYYLLNFYQLIAINS